MMKLMIIINRASYHTYVHREIDKVLCTTGSSIFLIADTFIQQQMAMKRR